MNKLGKDIAQPVFAETEQKLRAAFAEAQADMQTRTSLQEAFKADVSSWIGADGSVQDLNNQQDIAGLGTQESPYIIYSVRGWVWFFVKATFRPANNLTSQPDYIFAELGNDIDFSGLNYDFTIEALDAQGNSLGKFAGLFGQLDGKGYALKNMLISGAGLFTSFGCYFDGESFVQYEGDKTRLVDLRVQCTNYLSPIGFGLGLALGSYNSEFKNVNFDYLFTNSDSGLIFYDISGNKFVDCTFNLSGANAFVSGVLASPAMLGIEVEVGDTIFFGCEANFEIYSGMATYVWQTMGPGATIENCVAKGQVYSTASGEGTYMGAFISWVTELSSPFKIVNCVNFMTIASTNDCGGIVGQVYRSKSNLHILNCENRGDIYYFGSGSDSVGGIVGNVDYGSLNVTVENCRNYGDIYTGESQGGIIGCITEGEAVIKGCSNFGNVYHPLLKAGVFPCAAAGGIATIAEGSVIIENCESSSLVYSYSEQEAKDKGYFYQESYYFNGATLTAEFAHASNAFTGVAGILSCGFTLSESPQISSISIRNCKSSLKVVNGANAAGIFNSNSMGVGTSVSIKDCSTFMQIEGSGSGQKMKNGEQLSFNFGLAYISVSQASVEISGCFSEVQAKSSSSGYGAGICAVSQLAIGGTPSSASIEFVQAKTFLDLSAKDVGAFEHITDVGSPKDFIGFFGKTLMSVDTDLEKISARNILSQMEIKASGQVSALFEESSLIQVPAVSDGVFMEYKIGMAESVNHIKRLLQKQADLALSGSDWFYTDKFGGEIPKLRKFFWQEYETQPQDDIFEKFTELGFTQYDVA